MKVPFDIFPFIIENISFQGLRTSVTLCSWEYRIRELNTKEIANILINKKHFMKKFLNKSLKFAKRKFKALIEASDEYEKSQFHKYG